MKTVAILLLFFCGCSITSPKPFPASKTNLKETYSEKTTVIPSRQFNMPTMPSVGPREVSLPSSNVVLPQMDGIVITEKSWMKEDLSATSPVFTPQPAPPTLFQKIRTFVLKYLIVFGILAILFPSVAVMILTFILRRTRTAMGQVISGVQDFLDKDEVGNKELKNSLSKKMDVYAKKLVNRLK